MIARQLRPCGLMLLAACALALDPAAAPAQFLPGNGKKTAGNGQASDTPQVLTFPGVNIPAPNSNLTQEQWQSMIQLRALQSRGRGQVRTGIPQFIPLGMPAMTFPQTGIPAEQQADPDRSSSVEKRIAARKAAEEKKRAAREAAKAKLKDKDAKAKPKAAKPPKAKVAKPKDAPAK